MPKPYSFWDEVDKKYANPRGKRKCISGISSNCKKVVIGYKENRVCDKCKHLIFLRDNPYFMTHSKESINE